MNRIQVNSTFIGLDIDIENPPASLEGELISSLNASIPSNSYHSH